MHYKTNKSASLRYLDTCFMHNVGGVSGSLYMYYIDKESCDRGLPEIPPMLCVKHVSK